MFVIDLQMGVKESLKLGIRRTGGMHGGREEGKPKLSNLKYFWANKSLLNIK